MKRSAKKKNAPAPITFVTNIWLKAPTHIAKAPFTRLPRSRYKIRPPYSPTRFGVKIASVNPASNDSVDFHKETHSILRTRYFHLNTSVPQFTSISNPVITSNQIVRGEKGWLRSDERRVGKEWVSTGRSRCGPDH